MSGCNFGLVLDLKLEKVLLFDIIRLLVKKLILIWQRGGHFGGHLGFLKLLKDILLISS